MSGTDRHEDERFTDEQLFTADDEFPRDPPPRPVEDVIHDLDNYQPS
ncbi:hypothetical protein ACFVYP_06970 [Kitasatospora sp. NPDC058201]